MSESTKKKDPKEIQTQDKSFVGVVLMTFSTVFLAELGDKTQLATMLLTAQSGNPLIVFLGSASALICSTLVAVLIGRWLSNKVPQEKFKFMAGTLMIGIGLWIGIQTINSITVK